VCEYGITGTRVLDMAEKIRPQGRPMDVETNLYEK